jgi:hypothetical protein
MSALIGSVASQTLTAISARTRFAREPERVQLSAGDVGPGASNMRGTANGYEPRAGKAGITLANCPFHSLARDHTDLVCEMNLDPLRGLVETLDQTKLDPHLDPSPGRCCVTVERARAS